ncbi:MAG: flavodoxin-dependent (E)-4-hydroxy-3-methylbut-2-enyl-diphosphate synthase [Holosporales bacterium]|jgi:(E)-4-hydroxy-3-methylbut-2-enyl-diphosphate synthase|nr:flavodoxin-dependent (E)-4-hydroxy-3-methylbut-2-enyl-diphosphate synthase [Holosporales bacterium]
MASKNRISVGAIEIGDGSPISVQTMTNTNTEDVRATLAQIDRAKSAGCDLIRISCPTKDSTIALREILRSDQKIPIIADIHFDYRRAIEAIEAGVHGIRINPGNIDSTALQEIVKALKNADCALRIGVNSGSIERDILDKYREPTAEALVESAVLNCRKLEDLDFTRVKVSVKSSNVRTSVTAYRMLSQSIDYPLHVGITEAGTCFPGTIKSAVGIGSLLLDGIGDTIRVSLSGDIAEEVKVGRQILKSLGLLAGSIDIVSCPTCSRTLIDVIGLSKALEEYCENIYLNMKISILGCVVNGPGEASNSDIGIFGFKKGHAKVFVSGKELGIFEENRLLDLMMGIVINLKSS